MACTRQAWPSADLRDRQAARRVNAGLSGFHPRRSVRQGSVRRRRWVPSAAPATGPASLLQRPRAKAACAAKSRPLPAADGASRLGSKQAVTSPPTAAVRLNSGATPTPRRAERPDRLGRDGWQRAGGNARRNERARGTRAARTTPQHGPEEKSHGARAPTRGPRGKATPPHGVAANRCEREGQPRSHAAEAIKGAAGGAARSFTPGSEGFVFHCR